MLHQQYPFEQTIMDLGERKGRIMSFSIENGEKSIHHSANSNIVLAKIKSDGFTGDMSIHQFSLFNWPLCSTLLNFAQPCSVYIEIPHEGKNLDCKRMMWENFLWVRRLVTQLRLLCLLPNYMLDEMHRKCNENGCMRWDL